MVKKIGLGLVMMVALFASAAQSFGCDNCIAKQKARQQASEGRMRHVGGSMGSGRYEGVGMSSSSADAAIKQCCYWGVRTPTGIGVARGTNGRFYACVLYR